MVVAIGLLLTFLNRSVRSPAAVVGGVGFGFFIDELGKFVTSDNNYFFEPAAACIYLIFVALFLTIHALQRRRGLTPQESVANAVALLAAAATGDLDERGRERALALLDRGDPADRLVSQTRVLLGEVAAMPAKPPTALGRVAITARGRYLELVEQRAFVTAVCVIVALWGALSLVATFELVLSVAVQRGGDADLSFINLASLVSSTVSGALVAVGIRRLLRGDRAGAYREFERALLVSIFVTRTFSFVESQFGAVFGLAIDVALLFTLRRMAGSERRT
jgi:hypothetical protein